MPFTSSSTHAKLLFYYGRGELESLVRFERVVLQDGHYSHDEVAELAASGTRPIVYLSLGEDAGPAAPWQKSARNPDWGGHHVDLSHPAWGDHLERQVESALNKGFGGLFLDTLDRAAEDPAAASAAEALVGRLRRAAGDAYVIANRGHALRHLLAPLVDAFLFEAFSTTWADGYRALSHHELLENLRRLHALQSTGREVFALDYADRPGLEAFARSRAEAQRLDLQVTNRDITMLPVG